MSAVCSYLQLGKSFSMPAYDCAQAIEEFGIRPSDRVLDVGGGDNPFQRADVIAEAYLSDSQHRDGRRIQTDQRYVECFAECMPFADKEFDFVYCNHVLEHTHDPAAACQELMRVAKRGYIEVPAYWSEYLTGGHHTHRWLLSWENNCLVFRSKPWLQAKNAPQDTPFAGALQRYWFADAEFQQLWQRQHRNLWTIQVMWDDHFEFRVESGPRSSSLTGSDTTSIMRQTPQGERLVPLANAFGSNLSPDAFRAQAGYHVEAIHSDPAQGLPIADKALEFVICSDVLQQSSDPAQACEELMRVANGGYLEVPHAWTELLLGSPTHRWLIELVDGVLTFRRRPFLRSPFNQILRRNWFGDLDFRHRYEFEFRNLSRIQLTWQGRFEYRVLDDDTGYDYDQPDQAGMAHLVFALNDKEHGVPVDALRENLEKAVEFTPQSARAWHELGLCKEAAGSRDEARECFSLARLLGLGTTGFSPTPGISAIIHTLNEEKRVEAALQSLAGWVDEIIVVDMHSEDRTVEIARRYTDRVFLHERIRDFDAARNYSADLARFDWVLYLDADERVLPRLAERIPQLIRELPETVVGVQLPYKNHFLGKWMEHAGRWWPGYKAPMLLRKGKFHWPGQMHAAPNCQGLVVQYPADTSEEAIHHETCPSTTHYLRKLDVYTEAEAAYLLESGAPFDWRTAISGFVRDFRVYYDETQGNQDGAHGFLLAFLSAVYRFTVQAKLFESRYQQGLVTEAESRVPASLEEILQYAFAIAQGKTSPPSVSPNLTQHHEAAQDLMDYLGISPDEYRRRLEDCGAELRSKWLELDPQTDADLRRYYGEIEGYLYELTNFNYQPNYYMRWRDTMGRYCLEGVAERGSLQVLDYGGGIGSNLVDLTRIPGVQGCHADVPSRHFEYAAWRYRRHGAPVDMLAIMDDDPLGDRMFDVILCMDVLEHLKDPEQTCRYLLDHLRPGGVLIATVWFELENPEDEGIVHLNTDRYTNDSFWSLVEGMGVSLAEAPQDMHLRVFRKPVEASVLWLIDPQSPDETLEQALGLEAMGIHVKLDGASSHPKGQHAPFEAMSRYGLSQEHQVIARVCPQRLEHLPQAVRRIGQARIEADRLPTEWVAACNAFDEIWVPSDVDRDAFARAGVARHKLHKISYPLDSARFRGDLAPLAIEGMRGFNFLSVLDWSSRHGWDVLLNAYLSEFSAEEDVALVLKVDLSRHSLDQVQLQLLDFVQRRLGMDPQRIPDMIVLDTPIPDETMPRLYKTADAFVLPCRYEGWGRHFMHAMAMGLPTIGTGWGGHTEFMTPENAYLIDYVLAPAAPTNGVELPSEGIPWAEPSVEHLRALLRAVFNHREVALGKGAQAREEVLARYDRKRIGALIAEQLGLAAGLTVSPIKPEVERSS